VEPLEETMTEYVRQMKKYIHLERLGHRNTRGIDLGLVHIFPKLDGTNARIKRVDGELLCGSRNRELQWEEAGDDHFGFQSWVLREKDNFHDLFDLLPEGSTLYGEWLVPHTLKTYRDDAWRKFYLFDVATAAVYDDQERFMHYDQYAPLAGECNIECIHPIATANSPSNEQLVKLMYSNTYLIEDGCGVGEGLVLKNYGWENFEGKQVWAKIVKNEFREQNKLKFGAPEIGKSKLPEVVLVDSAVTPTLVAKERAKLQELPRERLIPALFQSVFYCLVTEELWEALKKQKFPTIDFHKVQQLTTMKVKEYAEDLF
jgi:hypothetical protein